jgi:hypothetical protein
MAPKKSKNAAPKTQMVEDLDPSQVYFLPFDKVKSTPGVERTGAQLTSFVSYGGKESRDPVVFKTDIIHIVQGGIPKLSEYVKDDESRGYFRIPHDPTQESSNNLFKFLAKLDEMALNEKSNLFSADVVKKYDYIPLVRILEEDPEKKSSEKPLFRCKVQFNTEYDTATKQKTLACPIYVQDPDGKKHPIENISSVSDIEKHFGWRSKAQFIIQVKKIWASKKDVKGRRDYGLALTCLQILVTERGQGGGSSLKKQFRDKCAFGDSDNESEEESSEGEEEKGSDDESKGKEKESHESSDDEKKENESHESSDEEETKEEESSSEEEVVKPPSPQPAKKRGAKK